MASAGGVKGRGAKRLVGKKHASRREDGCSSAGRSAGGACTVAARVLGRDEVNIFFTLDSWFVSWPEHGRRTVAARVFGRGEPLGRRGGQQEVRRPAREGHEEEGGARGPAPPARMGELRRAEPLQARQNAT